MSLSFRVRGFTLGVEVRSFEFISPELGTSARNRRVGGDILLVGYLFSKNFGVVGMTPDV